MSESAPQFSEKFIAFIDILGFKVLVEAAEKNESVDLSDVLQLVEQLNLSAFASELNRGLTPCPRSERIDQLGAFAWTQVSDCVVISTEVSSFGLAQMLAACWRVAVGLMQKGALCRGFVTKGKVFHDQKHLLGTGYQRAYQRERLVAAFARSDGDDGTPYIEIDPVVTDYALTVADECARDRYRYCTQSDGEVDALFPFRAYEQSFVTGGPYAKHVNYTRLRAGESGLREDIQLLQSQLWESLNCNDPRVVRKVEHYYAALERQLTSSLFRMHLLGKMP